MHAVIMAGGSGTRFWPASRRKRPKQFLRITGDTPLVVETCDRLAPVARDEEMTLVLGAEHMPEARDLFDGRGVHLIGEPVGRNTAPCIGLGALYAQHLGCRGPVAFMPADHYIADSQAFLNALKTAESAANDGGIVTLGIVPTRPETGYGYIRRGDVVSDGGEIPVHRVSAFVEKPDRAAALAYLESRTYHWNAGIFVATPEVILQEIEACLPDLFAGLERLEGALGTDALEREMVEVYTEIEPVSFDYGIMERTTAPVLVVPCECGWSDVGSWESLYELRAAELDPDGNLALGETELVDCRNLFVASQGGRLVACLGMDDCLVVDTSDALLVAPRRRSQEVRRIVHALEQKGKESFL